MCTQKCRVCLFIHKILSPSDFPLPSERTPVSLGRARLLRSSWLQGGFLLLISSFEKNASMIRLSKDSNIQKFNYPKIRISKDSIIQKFNCSKFRRFEYPKIQLFKDSTIRRFYYPKIRLSKDLIIQ